MPPSSYMSEKYISSVNMPNINKDDLTKKEMNKNMQYATGHVSSQCFITYHRKQHLYKMPRKPYAKHTQSRTNTRDIVHQI